MRTIMSIDWDLIFGTNLDELNDEKAESLYDQLIEYTPEDENDTQRLKRLFIVCKSVMQIKALQADVAVEELEEIAKKRYDKTEIEILKKELEIYRQSGNNSGDIAQKLSAANEQIFQLKNTIETKENEIIKTKRKLNDLQNNFDIKEKEVMGLRSEVDSLREEIENQRQVEEEIVERQEPIEKLREKNKQIQSLLDELRDIETVNLELANQVKKLKLELNNATNQIQISCNQVEMLRQQIKQLQELNEDFVKEKSFLMSEIRILRETIDKYENEDDSIADKFNEKIEQLRQLIQLKDEEITQLRSLSIMPVNDQKEKQLKAYEQMKERDKQIELLQSQLNEAVIDMENQTEIIQKLMQQNKTEQQVVSLNQQIATLNNNLKSIEQEVEAKDEQLLALRKRINLYESGEYGLKHALKEINDLQKHLNNREQTIEEMVQQINQLKFQLNEAADQIELLTEGNSELSSTSSAPDNEKSRKSTKKDKILFLQMQQQLLKLEEEKIALTEQLRANCSKASADKQQEYQQINKLKDQLKEVETENFELQLGMKEILNGIRESDSKSDVVIECPSLERVCQLLESRTISPDLTNVIVLKAELDLVRGHNEQLRVEMRKLRNDYLKVISQYTQDLLENDSIVVLTDRTNHLEVSYNHVSHESQLINQEEVGVEENDSSQANYTDDHVEEERQEGGGEQEGEEREEGEEGEVEGGGGEVEEREGEEGEDEEEEEEGGREGTGEEVRKEKQEDSISLSKNIEIIVVNQGSQTMPMSEINDGKEAKDRVEVSRWTQTEQNYNEVAAKESSSDIPAKQLCENCAKVLKIVDFLKNSVDKLQENVRSSETKYAQQLKLLQQENKNLMDSLKKKLNEKDLQLIEKEAEISLLEKKIADKDLVVGEESSFSGQYKEDSFNKSKYKSETRPLLSSSCKTVLESIINCLQARLEHKDESIKQYQNMLQEAKQNFENEMIRLIENNQENEQKISMDLARMIDNEELQSALKSCVNELEICKTELNAKISQLEDELERTNANLKIYQNENEQLKMKRTAPNVQLKQLIEELREECKQKDTIINNLNKTIKDDRSMRAMSAVRKLKDDSVSKNKKVDNQMFQEIANLRAEIETQKTTIRNLEVLKWEYEKNLSEMKEQTKLKIKEKELQISNLQQKLEKVKARLTKNENEKQLLQSKIVKKDSIRKSSFSKSTQTNYVSADDPEKKKLKRDLKKFENDMKELESEAKQLKESLELKRQIESELKILLQESLKREKLATIYEENLDLDKQYETLLQENAQLKVELRMAEFELKRR